MTAKDELEFEATCLTESLNRLGKNLETMSEDPEGFTQYVETIYVANACLERLRIVLNELGESVEDVDQRLTGLAGIRKTLLDPIRK